MREPKKTRGIFEKIPGSGIWWIRYTDTEGRLRREKAGSKSAAVTLVGNRRTAAWEGKKLPKKLRSRVVRFAELADDYLAYAKSHNLGWRADKDRIATLKGAFGDRSAEIPIGDLRAWFDRQEWAPATYNRMKTVLRSAYKLAIESGKLQENPARLLKARRPPSGIVRFLETDEDSRLRKVIVTKYPEHAPEYEIAVGTGLRRKEQYVLLTWACVDFLRSDLFVPASKNGRSRHIPMSPAVREAFQSLYAKRKGQDPIFRAERGGAPLLSAKHWFEPAVEEAKIPNFTWHCLRHTFASRAVMSGVDLSTVAELLGHSTTAMTCRYAHLSPGHKVAAIAKLVAFTAQERKEQEAKEAATAAILISAGVEKRTGTTTDTGVNSAPAMVSEKVQ